MSIEVMPAKGDVTSIACDALIVAAGSKDGSVVLSEAAEHLDREFDGYLSSYLKEISYKGEGREIAIFPSFGKVAASTIVVVGVDKKGDGIKRVRRAAAACARRLSERSVIASTLHSVEAGTVAASIEGFVLGAYKSPTRKKDAKKSKIERIELLDADKADIARGLVYAAATIIARDLVNQPGSELTPTTFAERAQLIASETGLDCDVLDEKELRKRGFGGLLAVAQGSVNPPKLIQLRYSPRGAKERVALVGKGVTFDSGGLSLKTAGGMEDMKTDMGGGAAVIGAMSALSRLKPKIEVIALIPATENMPSGSAIKPGDVIQHYGGLTTEVLNTDAEGRLILADALVLASEQEPKAIIDAATLTGSMSIALGHKMTGAFSNDDELWEEFAAAAGRAGEPMWRMPLVEDYRKSLDSDVADMKNIGTRYGGAVVAALFLREFVGEKIPWIHLDIAGTGRAEGESDDGPRGATGVATRTLIAWLEKRGR
ncbi:MAG TPA: leucyl aminopeptidase [Actinomycetota bacterium]|nr:leucyl aminopeptidase [Actinomycetota bacterium]